MGRIFIAIAEPFILLGSLKVLEKRVKSVDEYTVAL